MTKKKQAKLYIKNQIRFNKLFAEQLVLVTHDIAFSFTDEQLRNDFINFEDFWGTIDVQNAYEDEWEAQKESLKPVYKFVFKTLTGMD